MNSHKVVLLDRDGIVNELVSRHPDGRGESPLDPPEVRLVPGASDSLKLMRSAGFLLACVTNQPSAAKGIVGIDDVLAVQGTVLELLRDDGVVFDAVRLCPHHPRARRPALLGPCPCRKPAPGMLLDVLRELEADAGGSWMIGDTDSDVLAGQAAGVHTVLVQNDASRHKRSGRVYPDLAVSSLGDAVAIVVGGCGSPLHWGR